MKNVVIAIILSGLCSYRQSDSSFQMPSKIETELKDVQEWFDAWELVANDILNLPPHEPPLMLFFDEKFVYTNLPYPSENSVKIDGPRFFSKELSWNKVEHQDSLHLPNGQRVPVRLMSFTAPVQSGSKDAFFVMGLPSFWKSAGVTSEELGDENLYTSIFLHEFAHSQQSKNFGVRLDQFDEEYTFEFALSDDMIQEDFEADSTYAKTIKSEVDTFYAAFFADGMAGTKQLTIKGLNQYNRRQEKYFVGRKATYRELDDFFLTMEGIGQYVAVAWLTHSQGGDLVIETAIKGMRRGGRWWSQDEGLAMFLVYTKLSNPDLGKEMFSTQLNKVNELLEKQVR